MRKFQCSQIIGSVHISDIDSLAQKLNKIKFDGVEHLQIVTDFDQTLTRQHFNEQKSGDSTFKTIINWSGTPLHVKQQCSEYFNHYYPIERDSTLSHSDKAIKIREWWEKDFTAFAQVGYSPSCFFKMVAESKILFRSGVSSLFKFHVDQGVPLYILSAGVQEIIDVSLELLSQETGVRPREDTFKVISNKFIYDDGKTVSFGDLVTSTNKQKVLYQLDDHRRNVILMGDILEDSLMACDTRHDTVLRIGFLNVLDKQDYSQNLKRYQQVFDIVIAEDGGLEPIIHILEQIKGLSGEKVPHPGQSIKGFEMLDSILQSINFKQ